MAMKVGIFGLPIAIMRRIIACIVCILTVTSLRAQDSEPLLSRLKQTLLQAPEYDRIKLRTIDSLKQQLQQPGNQTPPAAFTIYARLFEAYKLFHYDSAYHYARLLQQTACRMKDKGRIAYARIQLGFTLLSAGMYKEAEDSLANMYILAEPDSIKALYYSQMARYYYDLGDFDNDAYHKPVYIRKGDV